MRVGFIGLGTMGGPMAVNILKGGHQVTVFNRTPERMDPVVAQGAVAAASPGEAAGDAEIIITMVSDTPDVRAVLTGEDGVIHATKAGSLVVDMSTISPEATREMAAELAGRGIAMLDAPVSGGSEGAIKATLTIMVGGAAADLERARPVLECMGTNITHVGDVGAGQLAKMVNQIIVAGNYLSVAEGMAYGLKAGLDMDKVVAAIRGGAAGSWVLDNRSGNMINNTYPLGFRTVLHRKDLEIALGSARELGVFLPLAALVAQIENGLISRGLGDEDMSNLARAIRELSGLD